jgi:transcriptional regulator with XRE-family HTH domain
MGDEMTPQLEAELAQLGRRLQALRNARGWTLLDLAARTGISQAYLSRIEGGARQPSLAVLLELARTYGTTLAALFESTPAAEQEVVVRAEGSPLQEANGLFYAPLSRAADLATLQPLRVLVPASRAGDEQYQHDGEEWLYVLSGQLRLTLADEPFLLAPGDAAHFDARTPHRLAAVGGDAEVLLVAAIDKRPLWAVHAHPVATEAVGGRRAQRVIAGRIGDNG